MVGRLLRVLFGFAVACLAAGLTLVLFVITPSELSGLPPDVMYNRLGKALELATYVAVQAALFAAPFALVVAALGEALRNRAWTYYVIAALAITGLGFYAQHSTEKLGQPTIMNNYAMLAFLTAGVMSGLVFWLFSGRFAGGPQTALVRAAPLEPRQIGSKAEPIKPVEPAKVDAVAAGAGNISNGKTEAKPT